jgi:hypothetical protein
MFNLDWRTSIAGLLAAVLPWVRGIVPEALAPIVDAASSLALALLGYFAADKRPAA